MVRREEPYPLRHRGQADLVIPVPERGAEGGHVRDEPGMLASWQNGVTGRDQQPADVAHHDGQHGVLALAVHAHGHHGVIDALRGLVHDPCPPDQVLAAHAVAAGPHDPIRCHAEPLDEVAIRAHHDPLEYRARPRVSRHDRLPRGGPDQQLGC